MSAPPFPDLGSLLELRSARDAARVELHWWLCGSPPRPPGMTSLGWYSAWRECERAELRLQSAQWYQAVRSHRWARIDATEGYPDANWWWIWRGVMALRWRLAARGVRPAGHNRSTEVALRDPAPVVCSDLFRLE